MSKYWKIIYSKFNPKAWRKRKCQCGDPSCTNVLRIHRRGSTIAIWWEGKKGSREHISPDIKLNYKDFLKMIEGCEVDPAPKRKLTKL